VAPKQLDPAQALLVVIDLQKKILPHIHRWEQVVKRTCLFIHAAKIIGIPILWSEQYRKGLGGTVEEIAEVIGDSALPMGKMAFGCLCDDAINEAAIGSGCRQLILCGIESHVCVLQTALKALEEDWDVFLLEDAVSSRHESDHETALKRMVQAGAVPATVEMLIMESLVIAGGERFKAILPMLKD
jgi:nicotinamidase-related amidase